MTTITHISQLEKHSTWRKFKRNIAKIESYYTNPLDIKAAKEKYAYEWAQKSFLTFAYLMTDGMLEVEPFHELIGSLFEDLANRVYPRAIISCPPRSGKSFLSSLFLAWLTGRDDSAQHILGSYGKSLSNKLFSDAYNYLNHPNFSKVFPGWQGFDGTFKTKFANKGLVLVTSVGGPCTGFTAGTLVLRKKPEDWGVGATIIDDPVKGSDSAAAFRELETWWQEQASTRRTNNWCQLLIGTRFSSYDLHGFLMKTDGLYDPILNPRGWRWLNIKALCENEAVDPLGRLNGQSHWPSNPLFTTEMLEQQRKVMGANKFSALYQGEPIAAEGSIVRPNLISFIDNIDRRKAERVWISLDTAYSEKQTADDSVLTAMGCNPNTDDFVEVYEMVKGKMSFPDLIEATKELASYYRTNTLVIENKASGISLIQILQRETNFTIIPMKADKSKTVRLQMVLPILENNRVRFKKGLWNDDFYEQITTFPLCKYDDMVDSFVHGLIHYLITYDKHNKELNKTIATLSKKDLKKNKPGSYVGRSKLLPGGRRNRVGRANAWD